MNTSCLGQEGGQSHCTRKSNPFREQHATKTNIELSILNDLNAQMPASVPPLETLSHLYELELPCQLCFYAGGKKMFVESSPDQPIVRANRQKLREWLANGVDVQWDKHVSEIHQSSDSVELVFKDGSKAIGNMLVGADGVNSFGEFMNRCYLDTLERNDAHSSV